VIFASDALSGSRVVSTPFEGITNGNAAATPPPNPVEKPPDSSASRNVGAIVGGVVGGVAVLALIALALFVAVKRQRDRDQGEHYGEVVGGEENELLERDADELSSEVAALQAEGEGQTVAGASTGGMRAIDEDEVSDDEEDDEEKREIGLEDQIRVMVMNDDDEDTFESSVPIRRPVAEGSEVDEPLPPRFLTQEEIRSPRVYTCSDTVDL